MKKISLKLVSCNKNTDTYNIPLTNEENLLAVRVFTKINNSSSFMEIKEEESLVCCFRDKATEFLKQNGFQVNYVTNVYWIHCVSMKGKKVCYELKLE